MSVRLTLVCDTCQTQIEDVEDLDKTIQRLEWDFDPEWGHRCRACSVFRPESEPLLSVETSPAQEATGCKHCG